MAEYTKVFENPYPDGWEDLPSEKTPITASALQEHTDAIENIEEYLAENPIEGGGSGTDVQWEQVTTEGTKIAEITIDGESTDVFAPNGGSGSTVAWNQRTSSGTHIADITIDGTTTEIFAPNGGGGGGTSDYNDLDNKPQINNVELSGNKSADDLGLLTEVPRVSGQIGNRFLVEATYQSFVDAVCDFSKGVVTDEEFSEFSMGYNAFTRATSQHFEQLDATVGQANELLEGAL